MKRISRILFLICVFVSLSANAQMTTWENLKANQEVGLAGRGNPNELLVTVCYHQQKTVNLTVNYNIWGNYSDGSKFNLSDYVGKVKIYARKRDKNIQYKGFDNFFGDFEKSFTKAYDYRDPVKRSNAVLIASTTNLAATSLKSTKPLAAGEYLIYLAVDIKNFNLDRLPLLTEKMSRLGGKITKIGKQDITNYVRSGGKEGWGNAGTTGTPEKAQYPDGSKLLVPGFQILYSPEDEFAKYYRIPVIATTADGSLLTVVDGRQYHNHGLCNDIDIFARRSMDNGKTWSRPEPIFRGKFDRNGTAHCKDAHGYSNASIAAFNDGTVVVCALAENGVNTFRSASEGDNYTHVVYRVSRDNGRNWGPIEEINPILFGGTDNNPGMNPMKYKNRGSIASGQLVIVNKGVLQGKALCCLRINQTTDGKDVHKYDCFLYYDPKTNEWNSVKRTDKFRYDNGVLVGIPPETDEGDDFKYHQEDVDEGKIIEMKENKFIISYKSKAYKSREFKYLSLTKAVVGDRTVIYPDTILNMNSDAMDLSAGCNGSIMRCKVNISGKIQPVLLHTVPKGHFTRLQDCSTNLSIFTAPFPDLNNMVVGRPIDWKFRMNISDWVDDGTKSDRNAFEGQYTIGGLSEVAQYSSITGQPDGTLGIFYEANSIPFLQNDNKLDPAHCSFPGDWVMNQYYLNLRIGDFMSETTPEDVPSKIVPPTITPNDGSYTTQVFGNRPAIRIAQNQKVGNVTNEPVIIKYSLDWYDKNNSLVKSTEFRTLGDETPDIQYSENLAWEDVAKSLGIPELIKDGYFLKVNAYCTTGTMSSVVVTKVYDFKACGFQTRVNSNYNAGKEFVYNTDYEYQEEDCPTFYSYWSSDGASTVDNVEILHTGDPDNKNNTQWKNNGETEPDDFALNVPGAKEDTSYDSNQPGVTAGTLKYSDKILDSDKPGVEKRPFRLDAYPTILPDAITASDFNAVVLCKVGDKYLTNEAGKIKYYLINGKKHPYGKKSGMYSQAAGVETWWKLNQDGNVIPKCVGLTQDTHSGMLEDVFYRPLDENGNIPWLMKNGEYVLDAKGNKQPDLNKTKKYVVKVEGALNFLDIQKSFPEGKFPKIIVEFRIISGGIANIDAVVNTNNYLYKVNHPIVYDETFTDVEEIENGMSESESRLTVAAAEGGATFTGEQMNVSVYNVMGMLVKNFYLDGEQFVELPQGIYIANGQKFIVR